MRDFPATINRKMSRRDFTLRGLRRALPAAALSAPAAQDNASGEQAKQLFAKAIVIDGLGALYGGDSLPDERRQEQARMIKESGLTAINLTVSIGGYDNARAATEYWKKETALRDSPFLLVGKAADIQAGEAAGQARFDSRLSRRGYARGRA